MKVHGKFYSIPLVSAALILFLVLVSSTASAATATCNVIGTQYQCWYSEQYPAIDLFGEKYVPLFVENNQVWQSHVDKLARSVIDSGSNYDLKTGENLDLGQGYSLQVKQVDVDGEKVWLEFDKDGQYVDDHIISTGSGDSTWNCTLDIQGINNVVVLKVHVNQITQSATESVVKIDGIWLIDYENTMTLKIGDKFGDYTLKDIIYGVNSSYLGSLVFDYGVTIKDLGTLGGSESRAYGINDKEQVVGESETGTGYERHAFLWQNGVMNDPGIGERFSCAERINENGQIVGHAYMENPSGNEISWSTHAFLWQNGVVTDIESSELGSFAKGINDRGQVVGYSAYEPDSKDAFTWQNGVITYITYGDLDRWTNAMGINENGQVVGCNGSAENGFANDDGHAFLWQNGVMTDIGTLGGSNSCAYGINDKGQIVGSSETDTGEYHAFLWQNGVMTDIGTLGGSNSYAYGINNKGQVVGESETGTSETHAFLWQNGVMIDMGTLGGSYSRAYEINENGQIVGESEMRTGYIHATLWTLPTSNIKPVANFSVSRTSRYAPLKVDFTDQSTNSPSAWNWNFGDGSINSTLQNPTHTYPTTGNYTVALTASNTAGSSTVTRIIHVTPPKGSEDIVSEIEVSDNRLREASPDGVYSDTSFIDIGGINRVRYRDVVQFDLSKYNSDTSIKNAALSLYWYYPAGKTRPNDTVIEVYRPASAWNSSYVSWNKRDKDTAWKNPGGDWYDKNGVFQGSIPYTTITIKGSSLPDNKYYKLDVTNLVKEYTSGKYENTGFLIKARTENNNYIAFYSSECGNKSQVPKLQLVYG
jgi:S-layer protein (TIGR01567 family)